MVNVIIPAAGVGTRLRPHTHTTPKALLPVAGQPILGHILDRLGAIPNLGTVRIVIGFLGEQIKAYVSEHFTLPVRFVQQDELLGLGHSVYLALEDTSDDSPTLVILGDTILDVNLAPFVSGPDDTLGVKAVDDPRRFGVVEEKDGFATRLVEKPAVPKSNLAIVGLYGIQKTTLLRKCLKDVVGRTQKSAGEIQMTDALQGMIEAGSRMRVLPVDGWFDCGKVETLLETNRYLLARRSLRYEIEGVVVIPPVHIAPSAVIERSVIGPYVSIGENSRITDSTLKNSIVADAAKVSHSILEDSIVGNNASVDQATAPVNVGDPSAADSR
jgi:glucose-1-phosphate thymidylyltransferase